MQPIFEGRVWLLGDDVDTDVIIPTEYLALPTVQAMAAHAFAPLRPALAAQIKPGDILVAGHNFGGGSSREQAPEVLKALGLACVIAKGYARIFYRNAVNNGLLLLEQHALPDAVREGDTLRVEVGRRALLNGQAYPLAPMPENVRDILNAGGLVPAAQQTARQMRLTARVRRAAGGGAVRAAPMPEEEPVPRAFRPPGAPAGPATAIEKIIARNTGRAGVAPGEIAVVRPDRVMIHDIFVPFVAERFEQMGFERIWNPDAVVLVYDHLVPAATGDDVRHHKAGDAFAARYGIKNLHRADGICHQLLIEQGYTGPGGVLLGTDSHTTTGGAVGAFATGIGYTEMAAVLGTGSLWVRVPATIRVELEGEWPAGVYPKDLALRLLADLGADGAAYMALEFGGKAAAGLPLEGRMTLANMAVEAGAKCAVFPPDAESRRYMAAQAPARAAEEDAALHADSGARYERVLRYSLDALEPMLACPSRVDNVRPVRELAGTPVDQVFIGSCTNGRLEDLRVAAEVLRGKAVPPHIRLIVTPASRQVYIRAAGEGVLTALAAAGATVTMSGCGLCCGRAGGIVAGGETVLSTSNRNFLGRMGPPTSRIYLASPAVAAATALAGRIALP